MYILLNISQLASSLQIIPFLLLFSVDILNYSKCCPSVNKKTSHSAMVSAPLSTTPFAFFLSYLVRVRSLDGLWPTIFDLRAFMITVNDHLM